MPEKVTLHIDYTRPSSFWAYLWQLPQVIVGLVFLSVLRKRKPFQNSRLTVHHVTFRASFCFSLGPFIFADDNTSESTLKHESGHSIQSLFLGPLYLPIVGLTSVILFWYMVIKHKNEQWYCSHFPENWADRLGGVSNLRKPAKDISEQRLKSNDKR